MHLSELIQAAGIEPGEITGDAVITSLTCNSKQVEPGACFVAIRGHDADGHVYIASAIERGAAAIICEDRAACGETPTVVVNSTREAVGRLAQAFHGHPAKKLKVVGITGTNGKTTVSWLLKDILVAAGHKPALLGTICYQTGLTEVPAATTTPDPIALASMMAEMLTAGQTHLVMEVSSHALDQDRVGGVDFQVAVLTNVTSDHMDYHKTAEAYLAAKLKLFKLLVPTAAAVVNRDDPAADSFLAVAPGAAVTYGLSGAADRFARIETIDIDGSRFLFTTDETETAMSTPLIGRHNIYNCLAAATAAEALGVGPETIAKALATVAHIPGRLQRVDSGRPFHVFVDYAHTDDALDNVLSALRPVTAGQLIVVFGCGGDRDRTKRPRMGRVAQELADRIVITSDNPRSEDPDKIIDEIVAGLDKNGLARTAILPDRREAMADAIGQAVAEDVVLIAGKGHETYQIIGRERIDFDDVAVAAEILAGENATE
jgi:UDP-N-acetylmuramoyl-L-alanyl-D-glutamate--2,6-diaminopimelate ligase